MPASIYEKATHKMIKVVLLSLVTSSQLLAKNLHWRDDELNCDWSLECSFTDRPIHEIRAPGDQCSTLCKTMKPCTHFSWTDKGGGVCKLHELPKIGKKSAKWVGKGAVCGVMK